MIVQGETTATSTVSASFNLIEITVIVICAFVSWGCVLRTKVLQKTDGFPKLKQPTKQGAVPNVRSGDCRKVAEQLKISWGAGHGLV
jgi:hypothetical protein